MKIWTNFTGCKISRLAIGECARTGGRTRKFWRKDGGVGFVYFKSWNVLVGSGRVGGEESYLR